MHTLFSFTESVPFKAMLALMLIVTMMLVCVIAVQATETPPLMDTTNFSVAYAHSFSGDGADFMLGKLSVPLFDTKITDTRSLTFGVDLLASLGDGAPHYGIGGSILINSAPWGLGLGIAYLPNSYDWCGTVTLVQIAL